MKNFKFINAFLLGVLVSFAYPVWAADDVADAEEEMRRVDEEIAQADGELTTAEAGKAQATSELRDTNTFAELKKQARYNKKGRIKKKIKRFDKKIAGAKSKLATAKGNRVQISARIRELTKQRQELKTAVKASEKKLIVLNDVNARMNSSKGVTDRQRVATIIKGLRAEDAIKVPKKRVTKKKTIRSRARAERRS